MCREQGLVGGYDMLAVFDRLQNKVLCGFGAADQLDHDVDCGIAHHRVCVIGNLGGVANQLARPPQVLVGDNLDHDAAAGTPDDLFLVAAEHDERAAAHGADTEKAHVYRFHRKSFRNENEVMKNPSRK